MTISDDEAVALAEAILERNRITTDPTNPRENRP